MEKGAHAEEQPSSCQLTRSDRWPGASRSERVEDASCPVRLTRIIELFHGKWTMHILYAMRVQPMRLSELKRAIPGASKKALTAGLRTLEAAGLLVRRDLSTSVLHVEYELKASMRESLAILLDELAGWAVIYESRRVPAPED